MNPELVRMHMINATSSTKCGDDDYVLEDVREVADIDTLLFDCDSETIYIPMYEVMYLDNKSFELSFYVPQTVVYKYNRPTAWYVSQKDDRGQYRLLKKRQTSLQNALVLKAFLKLAHDPLADNIDINPEKCDVSALPPDTFERQNAAKDDPFVAFFISRQGIIYLDRFELRTFLLLSKDKIDGVLQQFVHPKAAQTMKANYDSIRCSWTPSVTFVERRQNRYTIVGGTIKDKHKNKYERVETFDGTDFTNSIEAPVTSEKNLDNFHKLCSKLADHFYRISSKVLITLSFTLNFRLLDDGNIIFLWADNVRVVPITDLLLQKSGGLKQLGHKSVQEGTEISLITQHKMHPDVLMKAQEQCCFCHTISPRWELVEVSYKTLLAAHNQVFWASDITRHDWRRLPVLASNDTPLVENREGYSSDLWRYGPFTKESFTQPIENMIEIEIPDAGKNVVIPSFVKKLHPYITLEQYLISRRKPEFLTTAARLCQKCLFELTVGLAQNRKTVFESKTSSPCKNLRQRSLTIPLMNLACRTSSALDQLPSTSLVTTSTPVLQSVAETPIPTPSPKKLRKTPNLLKFPSIYVRPSNLSSKKKRNFT